MSVIAVFIQGDYNNRYTFFLQSPLLYNVYSVSAE